MECTLHEYDSQNLGAGIMSALATNKTSTILVQNTICALGNDNFPGDSQTRSDQCGVYFPRSYTVAGVFTAGAAPADGGWQAKHLQLIKKGHSWATTRIFTNFPAADHNASSPIEISSWIVLTV